MRDIYPRGDQRGRHRPRKVFYRYEYTPFDRWDVKPFDILLCRSRSLHGAAITIFSSTDGHPAWLSHAGQVMADGKTISEANFPRHNYADINDYLADQDKGTVRLTLVRLKPSIWPDKNTRARGYAACQEYHQRIAGRSYDAFKGLFPMMLVSILRNSIPFLKRGTWDHIPASAQETIFICSAIVDYGWRWAQEKLNRDFFPQTLSLVVPSPQDIFNSPDVEFVAGYRQVAYTTNKRR